MATKITKKVSEKKSKKKVEANVTDAACLEKFGINFTRKIMRVRVSGEWLEIDTKKGAGKKLLKYVEAAAEKLAETETGS